MKCRCNEIDYLDGVAAQKYAREHLQTVSINADDRQTEYVCPDTGKRWLEDCPYPAAHADGPPRLRAMPLKEE